MIIPFIDIESPFPDTINANEDGVLAYGADVSPERLMQAYPLGIFPWYNEGQPPIWWAPHERCVLFPKLMHASKNLRRIIRNKRFELRIDTAFDQVVQACSHVGENRAEGTWLNQELRASLSRLHDMGYAHSIESWRDGRLVGGLYGVSIGTIFFGESMFAAESEASKVALYYLCQWMIANGLELVDCQMPNDHLFSLGAQMLSRDEFYPMLEACVQKATIPGPWSADMD